jgi:hypothetical protein
MLDVKKATDKWTCAFLEQVLLEIHETYATIQKGLGMLHSVSEMARSTLTGKG